ncbi:hypothetical protein BXO88_05475 [Oribacterium sp. C9]|uniref:hypothetical protein n=1 Tax=Oribacterium sp. C9 TaxID=1943579 RepID=UPI00098F46BF|nr:hypothetical protein [Oribacterium sp. C9]OON86993.1 hypothetical protein BXO88_05475 [Oribacterium sp. C9]
MIRRNLCKIKRLTVTVLTVSLSTGVSVPALAANVIAVTGYQHGESIEAESVSSTDGSPAVMVSMSAGDEVTVDIKGDVETSGDSSSWQNISGVIAASSGKDADNVSKADVNIGGEVSVTVSSNKLTIGINASAEDEAVTEVSAKNVDVEAVDNDYGVIAGSYNKGKTTVEIEGDIRTVSSSDAAFGIFPSSDTGGTTTVTVGNDVGVKAYGNAEGVFAKVQSGTTKVDVSGSVMAETDTDLAIGVFLYTVDGNASATVMGDVVSSGPDADGVDLWSNNGDIYAYIGGDVVQKGQEGQAVQINKMADDTHIELVVNGTVSGSEHNLVFEKTGSTENIDITVWRVDTSGGKAVAENMMQDADTGEIEYSSAEGAEKQINYIIKTSPSISVSGNGRYISGSYTDNQDKTVYLKVDIPAGHMAEFYDINGNSNYRIVSDGNGNAYLVVPRGGGVEVGVRLTKLSTDTNSDDGSDTGNNKKTANTSDHMTALSKEVMGLQIITVNSAGTSQVQKVSDVLKPVDTLTAINNFSSDVSTMGTDNVKGAGVVSFNGLFADSVSDTVDVPVSAGVTIGETYKVLFSDGTSVLVLCTAEGILNIPFAKNADGLTYIIYGQELSPQVS